MNILSLLFVTTLLSVFVTGIFLLLVLSERNRLQLVLASTLGVFAGVMLLVLISIIQSAEYFRASLYSPFSFSTLALGFIVFFGAMSYYMVAARCNLFARRNGLFFSILLLLVLVVGISWHWGAAIPIDRTFLSQSEMEKNPFTLPIILRVGMHLFFLIYQVVMICIMWRPPVAHSQDCIMNTSDAVSNVHWLRRVVVGIVFIQTTYLLLVFRPSPWAFLIFGVTATLVFTYFFYNACVRRMYENTDEWQANWTPHNGWKIVEKALKSKTSKRAESAITDDPKSNGNIDYSLLIERWMKSEKPFCRTDFSIVCISRQFSEIDNKVLHQLLQKDAGSSQAYVRRHRIEEACRIIHCEKELKVTELALRVGFSHASSFSRAFSAVMGETVLQYALKVRGPTNAPKKSSSK